MQDSSAGALAEEMVAGKRERQWLLKQIILDEDADSELLNEREAADSTLQPPLPSCDLFEVLVNDLCHFEHGNPVLCRKPPSNFESELIIPLIGGVLKIVRLDVIPNFLSHHCARHWIGTNHAANSGLGVISLMNAPIWRALGRRFFG